MKKIIDHLKENWIRHGFETLVVTIGILGAFTLNNWNEDRKKEINTKAILQLIKADLLTDIEDLKVVSKVYEEKVDQIKLILEDSISGDSLFHCIKCNPILFYRLFNISNKGYEQLKDSKELDLYENDSLIFRIDDYYKRLQQRTERINTMIGVLANQTLDLIYSQEWGVEYGYDEVLTIKHKEDFMAFINSSRYRNQLVRNWRVIRNLPDEASGYIDRAQELVDELQRLEGK